MAVSFANLSADETAWFADDKPLLIGRNWGRVITTAAEAKWTANGSFADSDQTDTDFPWNLAFDEFDHLQTRPGSGTSERHFVMDLGASEPGEIDCVVLLNHNLGSTSSTVDIQIADDSTFATNLRTLVSSSPSNDNRLVFLDLDHSPGVPQRYSSVRYIRVKCTSGGSVIYKLGEVILGRRRQLKHKPNLPWDPNNLHSDVEDFISQSGVRTRYIKSKGRRFLNAILSPHETARISDIETLYETELEQGTKNLVWIDDPTTSPNSAHWFQLDPQLSGPLRGPSQRLFSFSGVEQGPNYKSAE